MKLLAQGGIPLGQLKGFGPLGNPGGNGIDVFSKVVSSTVGLMTIIAFIWFIFNFITGAIAIISSGGDKAALESARKKIINSIVGVVVVIAAIFVFQLIGALFGVDVLNLTTLFNQIQITK